MLILKKKEQKFSEKILLFLYLLNDFLFLSQMLILPPYQRKGLGRRILTAMYNDLRKDSCVQDVTGFIRCF